MVARIDNYHDNVRHDAIALVPEVAGRLLDFGGGIGATASYLKKSGRASFVVVADQVTDSLPNIDEVLRGDLEEIEFIRTIGKSGPFDTILCLDVLEHLRDPWRVVAELVEMLTSGGSIIVSVPNVSNRAIILPLLVQGKWELTDQGILDRTHLRWFTKASLTAMLNLPNMTVNRIEPTMIPRDRVLSKLSLGYLERFLAVQYMVSAIKA